MRKAQKEQICNFLAFVKQAQKKIKRNIEQENLLPLLGVLEDCQSGMNIIANLIKQTEGEDSYAISLLEKYCKLSSEIANALEEILIKENKITNVKAISQIKIDKIQKEVKDLGIFNKTQNELSNSEETFKNKNNSKNYIKISQNEKNENSVRDFNKRNQKQNYFFTIIEIMQEQKQVLQKIETTIHNITIKKQVVFLPYKASMWDSLESVWKAAEEDNNCETYVIPIPYFDRTAEGTFGELHYEGDLYPKDVPITHYQEFDLKEQQPDVIFIHNPYDAYNRVTSVHPDFYSDKLKMYTEKLIYIPYFVLAEIDLEDESTVESVAHFIKTPAVINADKVIVQSENLKKVYVKVLTEEFEESTRQTWENKILGLGSPKLAKVMERKEEILQIPKEWEHILQKQDTNRKKVVFYNTGLKAMLAYGEKYLEKIEDVLAFFKENQNEISLLWRPHPLMETTITSMRPQL